MINYFNFKEFNDRFLITNDLGKYAFVSREELKFLISNEQYLSEDKYRELTEKTFISENPLNELSDAVTNSMRNAKAYLFLATGLHIFVLTNQCNHACVYCQASAGSQKNMFMTKETAKKAVDIAVSSPNYHLSFEFQGGEPLLNFDTLRYIVDYTESLSADKDICFSVVTNLTLINDEMIEFFKNHKISISTSLDGPEKVHNLNRPFSNGSGSYQKVIDMIKHIQDAGLNVGAIQTTTKYSLEYAEEIVDEYISNGLQNIFIRPLTPLGAAGKIWNKIGYTADEFSRFYGQILDYIIQKNKSGVKISENHATIFLNKILHGYGTNYMELRSPCGAGFGQAAYYPDGEVFTCDEGRMLHETGNDSFRIGSVFMNSYEEMMSSPACKACAKASLLETIPGCCDCVYQPYCGVCPVINFALDGDITPNRPNNWRCKIYKGMLDKIFGILSENDPSSINILNSWIV